MASSCRSGIKRWDQAMRVGMGLIKNEHGVYHVRRKVPKALEVATARAMGVPKERVSWLKETLGTEAEIKAISDYFYAYELGTDQELREEGVGSDPMFAEVHRQLTEAGVEFGS